MIEDKNRAKNPLLDCQNHDYYDYWIYMIKDKNRAKNPSILKSGKSRFGNWRL